MVSFFCHKCSAPWEAVKRQPGFKETCTNCGVYLHCCKNCRFHTPSAHNQCYIPNTEYVTDRKGLNFCEEFEFRRGSLKSDTDTDKQQARDTLDNLFGNDNTPAESFDDLFEK